MRSCTCTAQNTIEETVLELRALQRRPAAEWGSAADESSATALNAQNGALRVVAQQGAKRGSNTVREEHNAMLRSLLCIKTE